MNYSKHVKSINGATKPNIGYRDHSIVKAKVSNYDCPIDVRVSLPAASCVETHIDCFVGEDRPSLSSVIQVSKVASLKSLHDVNMDLPTELDLPLRTSIHVLVQNSAPQAPDSSLAWNDEQASLQQKIVSKKVLTSNPTDKGLVSKPERTQWSCSTSTNVSGQVWDDHTRIDVDGEQLIG